MVLALSVALVAPYFIDWTSYRAEFEREASRVLGRDVKVQGTASARLLPFPSVTFSDVLVAGAEGEDAMMTIETFSMDAELAPFLRGEVLIFDMRLVRPHATIDIADDGTLDWAVRPSAPIGARQISLEKLTVTEGRATLRHTASGRTHELGEINADVSARSLAGPWRLDGTMLLDGLMTTVSLSTGALEENGSMRLRLRAQPERYGVAFETDGTARIVDGNAHYSGQFRLTAASQRGARPGPTTTANPAPPAYRVSGQFRLDHRRIVAEEFRLETGPLEDPYVADGSAEFELGAQPSFLVRADGAQVRFDDGAGGDGTQGVSLRRRLALLRETLLDLPRPTVPGRIEVRLPAIVAGDTTIRDVHLAAEPAEGGWRIGSIGASLPGRTTLEASGELSVGEELGFEGSLLLAVGQPSGFAAWLARDVDDAIRRLPAAGFSARVSLGEQRQHFTDLELMLGGARFRGEIEHLQSPSRRPSMSLSLEGDALDVEGMAAFASLFVSERGDSRLADHDLAFDIKAGPVSALGLRAGTLDTAMRLRDGQLEIDRLTIGDLAGANISATGSFRDLATRPVGSLDATLVSPDLAPLAGALAARDPESRFAGEMARRASLYPGLLADAQIDLVLSAAGGEGDGAGLALSATGEAGGDRYTLSGSLRGLDGALFDAPVSLRLTASNDEASTVYALLGLPALPIGYAGAVETELAIDGTLADGARLRLTFAGDDMEAALEGEMAVAAGGPAFKGTGRIGSGDLEPWLLTAGIGLPGAGLGLPVGLDVQVDYADGLVVLTELDGSIAGTPVQGDLNVQVQDGMPHLTGALALDMLDMGLLAEVVAGEAAFSGDGAGWPTAPFSQAVATPFTADIDLTASRLHAGHVASLADTRLKLRLSRDGVAVSDFSASLHGGRASGLFEFRNDRGTGILSAQLRLEDASVAEAARGSSLRGAVDIAASLSASGKSVSAIVSALAGSGNLSLRDLVIGGVNPVGLPAILQAADRFGPDIHDAATAEFAEPIARDGALRAERLELAFTLANGVARTPAFRLETPAAALSGEASADLGSGTVRADVALAWAAGEEALVGSEPTVRFAVQGPLDNLRVALETSALAQFLTQRALESEQARVEAMQSLLLEKQRHRREVRYYASLHDFRLRTEEERIRGEEAERLAAEAEAIRLAEEEVRRLAEEEEARLAAVEEARRQAAEEARAAEEVRLREENERLRAAIAAREAAEEEARQLAAEEESRRIAEVERRAAEEARLREENERLQAAIAAREAAEEEARQLAVEAERRRVAEAEERAAEEARLREANERLQAAIAARQGAEEEARQLAAEEESRRIAEVERRAAEEARLREENERLQEAIAARQAAEEEARQLAAEEESRRIAEVQQRTAEEARLREENERLQEAIAARQAAEAEARRLAAEEEQRRIAEVRQRAAEEARLREENERLQETIAARQAAEAEARRLAAEEERRRIAEAEERAAEEARLREENERLQLAVIAREEAEAEARRLAADEARLKAEAEERAAADQRLRAEEEERRLAEAQARQKAEAEMEAAELARVAAETEARRLAEEEARLRQEAEVHAAEETRLREENERLRAAEQARHAAEAEAVRLAGEEARLKAEAEERAAEEARLRAREEERRLAEAEARQRAEERALAAEEARLAAEEQVRLRLEAEATAAEEARRVAQEQQRLRAEAEARAEEEARLRELLSIEVERLRAELEALQRTRAPQPPALDDPEAIERAPLPPAATSEPLPEEGASRIDPHNFSRMLASDDMSLDELLIRLGAGR